VTVQFVIHRQSAIISLQFTGRHRSMRTMSAARRFSRRVSSRELSYFGRSSP